MKKIVTSVLVMSMIISSASFVSANKKENIQGYSNLYYNTFDNGNADVVAVSGDGFDLEILNTPENAAFDGNNGIWKSGGVTNNPVFQFNFNESLTTGVLKVGFDFNVSGTGSNRNSVVALNRTDGQWKAIDIMHIVENMYFIKDTVDSNGYMYDWPSSGEALDTNVHRVEIVLDIDNSVAYYYVDGIFAKEQTKLPASIENLVFYLQGDIKYFDNLSLEKYEELPMFAAVSEKDGELIVEFTDGIANKDALLSGAVIKNLYTGEKINAEALAIDDFEVKLIPEKEIVPGIEYMISFNDTLSGRLGGEFSEELIFNTAQYGLISSIELVTTTGESLKINDENPADIAYINFKFTEDVDAETAISGLTIENKENENKLSFTKECNGNTAKITLTDLMLGNSEYKLSLKEFNELYDEITIKTKEGKSFMLSPVLVDDSGNEISEIPENAPFGVKLVFGNTSDENKNYRTSISLYDDKLMTDIKLSDIKLLPGDKLTKVVNLTSYDISDPAVRGAVLNEDGTVAEFGLIQFGKVVPFDKAQLLGELLQIGDSGVKASFETQTMAYIDVLKDGTQISDITDETAKDLVVFRDYRLSDGDGISNFEFELSETGNYDVYVTDINTRSEKIDFTFVNNSDYKALAESIGEMDKEEIKKILTDSHDDFTKALLGISDSDISGLDTENLAEVIKNTIEDEPITDNRDLSWNIIDRTIFVQRLNESCIEDIQNEAENITHLDESEVKEWFEKSYTEESAFRKEFTKRLSGKDFESYKKYEDTISEAFILATVKEPDGSGNVEDIIRAFADKIGVDISKNEKTSIWTKLSGKDFDDFDDLAKGFSDAHKSAPSSGGGGSSGGGIKKPSVGAGNGFVTQPVLNNDLSIEKPSTEAIFNDLEDANWAKDSIIYLSDKGIINGVSENNFAPLNLITREQFVKISVLAFVPDAAMAENKFSDVADDAWYTDYIRKALTKGITNGIGNGKFGIGMNITRQDMCVMIYNAAKASGMEFKPTENPLFSDDATISDYAKEAVYALKNSGAVSGYGENDFRPLGNATRAEAAKIIYSLIK